LDDDFVKHKQDIINEIMRMMTPKGLISDEGLMSEQLNVISNKLAKTAKELIDQDELEIDQTVKIIDDLAKDFRVEMPAEYYFGLGNIYSNRQKYDKAIVYYDRLLERNPEDEVALANKGHAFFHLGRFSEALACIDKALEIDQQDAVAWGVRALILSELGKLDDAIKSHDKAIELDPKEWVFWYNKGVTLSTSGMNEEAIECYNKALEINPRNKYALINKCGVLQEISRFDETLECINKALEIYPKDAEFWNFKAGILYDLSQFDDALVCVNKALKIEPENCKFLGNKALILRKLDRTDDALESINKALKINQKDAYLWYQKGTLAEDFNEAIKYFGKALEFNPDFVEALCSKGSNLSNIGKYDEALKIFDEVENKCEKYDKCEIISMNKGITLFKVGKSKEAIKYFDKAIELNPRHTGAYIGVIYRELKQYEKEQEVHKKILELNPNHIDAMLELSESYIITKNYVNAHEMAENALNIAEENNDVIISHFLMLCSSLLQSKKEDAKSQLNRLIDYLETIKNWALTWDYSDVAPAISGLDEDAKTLMLSLIELLENKITLDEFKHNSIAQ
jgi:tetratricopeptide (TPR) repeat protein